jgi:hypothetical protein
MKLLRNPWVTGALAVVALAVVFFRLVAPHWHFGKPASTQTPVAPAAPAAPAMTRPVSLPETPVATASKTNANIATRPEAKIDRQYAESHFAGWVNAPQRDPFLLMLPAPLEVKASVTNSPVATWKLKAIWRQTGSRLAVINQGLFREGDEIIKGYKLEKIEGNEVWVQGPDRKERLGFEKDNPAIELAPAGAAPAQQPSGAANKQSPPSRS